MRKLSFIGRVLPEVRKTSTPKINPIRFTDPNGFEAIIDFTIIQGKIVVDFDILTECTNCIQFCMLRAQEITTAAVDVFAFSKGWALSIIIDAVIDGDITRNVVLSEKSVHNIYRLYEDESEFRNVMSIVFSNFNLRFALHDLVSSLSTMNYSAIAASRAVEAIRDLISPKTTEAQAWKAMRETLKIERGYLQTITDSSRKPRHGDRGSTDGLTQMMVTNRSWKIMSRYIEYMKRGANAPLPENEFPILTDS